MSSRPTKKRALQPLTGSSPMAMTVTNNSIGSSNTATTSSRSFLDNNNTNNSNSLDSSIYMDLEHERSLRSLDAKRYNHRIESLEKMIKFKDSELESCKMMLEDEQTQGEIHLDHLRRSRDEAIRQLRELQRRISQMDNSSSGSADGSSSLWQRKYTLLESQKEGTEKENRELKMQIRELRSILEEEANKKSAAAAGATGGEQPLTPTAAASVMVGQSSPAPSDLMHELNRVRIELAENERKSRQLRRTAEEWKNKAKNLLPEKEAARSHLIRCQKLETQLKEATSTLQTALLKNTEWHTFAKALLQHFPNNNHQTTSTKSHDFCSPPEASVIILQVQETKRKLEEAEQANKNLEQRTEKLRDMQRPTEERMKSFDQKEATWKEERKARLDQLSSKQRQIETLQHQERIWKREIQSLREMVHTFDKLPLAKSTGSMPSTDAKLRTAELELNSIREELQLVKADHSKIQQERQEQQKELERVKEKYGKLREALENQKGKAQEAEARAVRAEELAGKGSFNPDETMVLHLAKNPKSDNLIQQVTDLKKKLHALQQQAAGGGSGGAASTTTMTAGAHSEVNPDKLHQRLKESFKQQIGLFRESVYLMTGWKVDMLPYEKTFRVRSMFGENEDDYLMLRWPEGEDSPSSLDMLSTDWATSLSKTTSAEYMKRFSSLPAFLASAQLSLFENQTMMG